MLRDPIAEFAYHIEQLQLFSSNGMSTRNVQTRKRANDASAIKVSTGNESVGQNGDDHEQLSTDLL